MEKIKKLDDVILAGDMMLGELKKPKRYIVAPDGSKDEDSYIVILKVGPSVIDLTVNDIVIKYAGTMTGFPLKDSNGITKELVMMSRYSVLIAVKPDNFIDPDKVTASVNI
jgi:hypothetical protein